MPRRSWAVLLCATLLAYLPVLRGGFTFDDTRTITANQQRGDWGVLARAAGNLQGRGAFWATLLLDDVVWRGNPAGFHVTSVLLHLAVTALVAWLAPQGAGLAAGLAFGLHPLATSAGCYISQRSAMLSAFSALLCLGALRALAAEPDPGRRRRLAIAAWGAWALGFCSKESAVAIPPCMLAFLGVMPDGPGRPAVKSWLAAACATACALGAYGVFSLAARQGFFAAHWDSYAWTQFRVFWRYAALWVLPVGQCADPEVIPSEGWLSPPSTLSGAAALAAMLAALWAWRRRRPWAFAGGLAAVLTLLPDSSFVALPDLMFEFRTYPSVAFAALAIAPAISSALSSPRLRGGAAATLILMAGLSARRAWTWAEGPRLWREGLRAAPHKLRAHASLYRERRLVRDDASALAILSRTLKLKPGIPELYGELALIALDRGDAATGLACLDTAFRLEPGRPDCLPVLGYLRLMTGDHAGAAEALLQARDRFPSDERVLCELARALAMAGRTGEALALGPALEAAKAPEGLLTLGAVLGAHGEPAAAAQVLLRYVLRAPENPVGWANLAKAYTALGDGARAHEARRHALAACGNDPAFAELRRELEKR